MLKSEKRLTKTNLYQKVVKKAEKRPAFFVILMECNHVDFISLKSIKKYRYAVFILPFFRVLCYNDIV